MYFEETVVGIFEKDKGHEIQKCASAINTGDQMRDRQSDKTILDHVLCELACKKY